LQKLLRRLVDVKAEEVGALLWSFAYFFCLLCGYYILRPVRDAMGIAGGVKNLPWMFTATFAAMLAAVPLLSAAVARWPRRLFVPIIYRFFALNLLVFAALLWRGAAPQQVARVFFVWTSVFNLFVVSLFWGLMADLWRSEQGKRLFGFIAAGGTAGSLAGSLSTAAAVELVGAPTLLLASAALLEAGVWCAGRLVRLAPEVEGAGAERRRGADERVGGGVLDGIGLVFRSPYLLGIAAQTLLTTATATFLYLQQAHIVEAGLPSSAARAAFFAKIDLAGNLLTIALQAALTGRVLRRAGLFVGLAAVPALTAAGFLGLAAAPTLSVVAGFQVLRRASHYAFERPAREILFTVVSREEKYKSKVFLDTVVYRGSDAASSWAYAAMASAAGDAAMALAMLPLAGIWVVLAGYLARKQALRSREEEAARAAALAGAPEGG
jgi:AAA family ATP:ADP antiporter